MNKIFKVFDINFSFSKKIANDIIVNAIENKQKGTVFAVDGNLVTVANKNEKVLEILNSSIVNICDGGSIALIGSKIYGKEFERYPGPDLFNEFIKRGYKQAFLGNTEENLSKLKSKMIKNGIEVSGCLFKSLPFCSIDDFNYSAIANEMNRNYCQIIWVSLGAPKQEQFAYRLLPYIDNAVIVAVGAAFNYYIGLYKRAPRWLLILRMEWMYRIVLEPGKQVKRCGSYLFILPLLIVKEIWKKFFNQ